jgi:hypothetical protein
MSHAIDHVLRGGRLRRERQSRNAPLGEMAVVEDVEVVGVEVVGGEVVGVVVVGTPVVGGAEVVGTVEVDGPGTQAASQQLPVPTMPPLASHFSALDLVEQRFTTSAQFESSMHAVVPSSQKPFSQVPASQIVHVTKPLFLPHVERAAHLVTAPLQLTSRSPLLTASRTVRATQLTYCPWLPLHGHELVICARTVSTRESLQRACASRLDPRATVASMSPRIRCFIREPPSVRNVSNATSRSVAPTARLDPTIRRPLLHRSDLLRAGVNRPLVPVDGNDAGETVEPTTTSAPAHRPRRATSRVSRRNAASAHSTVTLFARFRG